MGVHHLFQHAHPRSLGGAGRQQRRAGEFVLEIFQDDGGIEDRDLAVDQGRHLAAWADPGEIALGGAGAEAAGRGQFEFDPFLAKGDLDLLGIGRKGMLIESDHGWPLGVRVQHATARTYGQSGQDGD
ncbi:MAG TPA: hypothetical protein VHZ26_16840 [Caulobacteraceae bacterium]|jgi:hypothetical protein|nr:hypothetical protein [Caulobacteraceae bacterium]